MNIPTETFWKKVSSKTLESDLDKPITKFFTKIDNTGRIYLPSAIRKRIQNNASFFAVVSERRIIISGNGRYPHRF